MHSRNSFYSLYFIFIIYTVILKPSCYCADSNPFTSKQEKPENLTTHSASSLFYSNKHAIKFHGVNKDGKGVITSSEGNIYTFKEEDVISIPEICSIPITVDFVNKDLVNFKNDLDQSIDFRFSCDVQYSSLIRYIGCNIKADKAAVEIESKIFFISSAETLNIDIKGMPTLINLSYFSKDDLAMNISHSYGCREEELQLRLEENLPDQLLAAGAIEHLSFKKKTQEGNVFLFNDQEITLSDKDMICISVDKKTCSIHKKPETNTNIIDALEKQFIVIPLQCFADRATVIIFSPFFFDVRITTL
ncbi:MAG: hypothetical protein KAH32_02475 [Chlamydiia bacterium]|nr:hypothetical protein [Chlamydiia bacterium]